MIRKAARSMLQISSSMEPSPPYHYSRTTTRSWYRPGPEGFARECCTQPFGQRSTRASALGEPKGECLGRVLLSPKGCVQPKALALLRKDEKCECQKDEKCISPFWPRASVSGGDVIFRKELRLPFVYVSCVNRSQVFQLREISFAFLYFLAFVGPRSSTHCAAHTANAIQSLADACSARSAHCSCRFMSSAAVRNIPRCPPPH